MSDVDFLVKLRDAATMIADAANEQLEKIAPTEVKYNEEDFEKIFWEAKEGSKGPYQQTSKTATNNHEIFQVLQKILKEHNGFWQSKAHKYWFDNQNPDVVDRRKK